MSDDLPTLRSIFPVDDDAAKRGIVNAVDGAVWDTLHIPRRFREAAAAKITGKINALLGVAMGDILAGALSSYRKFGQYADGKDHDVDQCEFSIESKHAPHVELEITNFPTQRVTFPVTLSLEFSGATLVIRNSRLMALRSGACSASGKLCCEKVELFKRPTSPLTLPGEIRFGKGLQIHPLPH